MSVFQKLELLYEQQQAQNDVEKNTDWVMSNRDDLAANFPNRWVAILNESVYLVNPDLYELYKIIENRPVSTDSMIFYFSMAIGNPLIVRVHNVTTPQTFS